jgi:DNA processing protein
VLDFSPNTSQQRCDDSDLTPCPSSKDGAADRASVAARPSLPDARAAELDAAMRLLLVPGIGVGRLRQLRIACGTFTRALDADPVAFAGALGMELAEAARLLTAARSRGEDAARELANIARLGATTRILSDDAYPALLRSSPDPPETLFVRGDLAAEPEPAVAVVGSRHATAYGRLEAGRLAAELAERGVVVVSGGARGIDAEAHRGAMRAGGRTIAVFAPGFAHPYPSEHRALFDAIVESGGALVTEQLTHISARPELFPRRNRIIAGLSLVTVVIEAANRSGALLTARIAVDDLSRDAACMPGPVGSAQSAGCHRAIREGWATLVTGAADVCEILFAARHLAAGAVEAAARGVDAAARGVDAAARGGHTGVVRPPGKRRATQPSGAQGGAATSTAPSAEISPDASALDSVLRRRRRASLDELMDELGWEVSRTTLALLDLERAGRVARDPDGGFASRKEVK